MGTLLDIVIATHEYYTKKHKSVTEKHHFLYNQSHSAQHDVLSFGKIEIIWLFICIILKLEKSFLLLRRSSLLTRFSKIK